MKSVAYGIDVDTGASEAPRPDALEVMRLNN